MLMVAALLTSLVMMVCLARKGAASEYFTQKSGYLEAPSPKSSSRTMMGQSAMTFLWNVALFWS